MKSSLSPTVWSWNIEAVDDGEQELEATLYVLLFLDAEKPDRQRISSFVQKISVSVRPLSWELCGRLGDEVDQAA